MWQGKYELRINQWGVGNGGFHSQSIHFQPLDRNPVSEAGVGTYLRVIYDCGSGRSKNPRSCLYRAVADMVDEMPPGTNVDLLVISHFDMDHVNGLKLLSEELKREGIRVDQIWTPLLSRIESLYAVMAFAGQDDNDISEYVHLVHNPIQVLAELFPRAEVRTISPNPEPIPLVPIEQARFGDGFDDGHDDEEVTLGVQPNGPGLTAKVSSVKSRKFESLWEFQPYVIESALAGSAAIEHEARALLGKSLDEATIDDLVRFSRDSTLWGKFHSAVLQHHKAARPESRTSSSRTGANLSTLIVYSGPVSPYEWCCHRAGWKALSENPYSVPFAPAWLGTGDAGLLAKSDVEGLRSVLTQSRLDRVGFSSAPHHGSSRDSGSPLWHALPNVKWVTIEADNSHGGVAHHHPHSSVVAELMGRNINLHYAVVGNDFKWTDRRHR
ncbi:hypothetical protein NLK69_01780 [Glutamicibacter endophyticus]|nr:hypothetical protein [Glutamicibacter sp. PS]